MLQVTAFLDTLDQGGAEFRFHSYRIWIEIWSAISNHVLRPVSASCFSLKVVLSVQCPLRAPIHNYRPEFVNVIIIQLFMKYYGGPLPDST